MSSDQLQREIRNERLAPAEDKFPEDKEIIKSEKEMIGQRRLLVDFSRTPLIILHKIELPKDCVLKEEKDLTELSHQEGKSKVKEEPLQIKQEQQQLEHQQIKEEEKELCISQNEDIFLLKEETDNTLIISNVESYCNEAEPNRNQLICQESTDADNQDQEESNSEDQEKIRDEEKKIEDRFQKTRQQNSTADSLEGKSHIKTNPDKKKQFYEIFDEIFSKNSDYCEKSFSNKRILTCHTRTHTGERPFSCSLCGKTYSQRSGLTYHMMIHKGEKPFTCTTCEKSFIHKGHLESHRRTHTDEKPYVCITCKKGFSRKTLLNDHIRIHTGEKPYSCTTCKRSFIKRWNLITHMRTHTRTHKVILPDRQSGVTRHTEVTLKQLDIDQAQPTT